MNIVFLNCINKERDLRHEIQ